MFGGFQANAFQNNAYQIGGSNPTTNPDTHDGLPKDYHGYRKKLRKIANARAEFEYGRIEKSAQVVSSVNIALDKKSTSKYKEVGDDYLSFILLMM